MYLRPPRSTRTYPLFPYTTRFRSDRDRDLASRGRLAVGIERDEFQAQIVLLHHPAVGLDAELDRGRIERDLLRGGERLAVRVLIIHLDPHARGAIEARRHVDRAACGAVGAQDRKSTRLNSSH